VAGVLVVALLVVDIVMAGDLVTRMAVVHLGLRHRPNLLADTLGGYRLVVNLSGRTPTNPVSDSL
jgi:hypothetical protein